MKRPKTRRVPVVEEFDRLRLGILGDGGGDDTAVFAATITSPRCLFTASTSGWPESSCRLTDSSRREEDGDVIGDHATLKPFGTELAKLLPYQRWNVLVSNGR